jgi:hypothetical protein
MVIFNIAVLALVIEARPIPNLPGRKSLKFQGGPQEVENVGVEKVERVKIVELLARATDGMNGGQLRSSECNSENASGPSH